MNMRKSNDMKKKLISIIVLSVAFVIPGFSQETGYKAMQDSLFEKISIDELISIKKFYDNKVEKLHKNEETALEEGKKLGESFLSEEASDITNRDKIYIRIAEYYIEEADMQYEKDNESFDDKFDAYEKEYTRFEAGEIDTEPEVPESPSKDYNKAIGVYEKLLDEYPASDFADDALYGKAWLLDKMKKGPQSRRLFQEVIDKYPDSKFAPESYIQLAEYYFKPREDKTTAEQAAIELRKAIQLYKKVLHYKDSPRYDEALYKLGWSYYKLAGQNPKYYSDAITYFVAVVDDINRAEELDPKNKISNPNVKEEAIEYIGISFTDEAYTATGVDKARGMIERLGGKAYGVDIMRAIGQTFQKIDEQDKAIYAFENLLDMYPNYYDAPLMQHNIATAVFAKGQDENAYGEREKLYTLYNPKSEWYAALEQSDNEDKVSYLKGAYKKSEEAFRTNLILDLETAQSMKAEGAPTAALWEKFGVGCRNYLDLFPSDSNAYDIHWNYALMLDQELGKFDEAFNEYLTVSNDYLEEHHQHDAALYAVGVADTIVKIKYGKEDSVEISLADIAQLSPEKLTPEETNLIQAYDNYIRLFPDGNYTPNFLASAGGIYYNHKKFAEAKVYFQTLVRRFPGAKEKSLAMRSIMDSYFALGKFKDSEIIAKRILSDTTLPEEQRTFASRRLAEAIFKNAEFLAEQGDYFTAANEYLRLYKEAPNDIRYVEPALWNAGINFQKAHDWIRSNEAFDIIASKYPKSKFAVDALNNIVDNYKELEQYANAAQTSERIYNAYPDIEDRESKLYNSSYFFEKAEDFTNAIRINTLYIAAYPTLAYSVDLFFKNAELYLKMDNIVEANRIYEEFAAKYPDDERVITAFYERGNYFFKNEQTEAAKIEYNKAIAKSEQFKREGKESNPFIAGEAVHKLAEILHKDFISVELKLPASNIENERKKLTGILTELNTAYTKVLAFGSPRSFEATYNIARSYEEFADIYVNQEIDKNLDNNKQFVNKKRINEQSAALYENAVNKYKDVIKNIPIIATKLEVDMFGDADSIMAAAQTNVEADSSVETREVEADSTRDMALKWYGKAKDKISELLYVQASLTSENVDNALAIESPSNDPLNTILYKASVNKSIIAPAVQQTIKAHIRNITEAQEYELKNKYVEESKRQILLTSNILANEYETLASTSLDQYEKYIAGYMELIDKEFGSKDAAGKDYYALENDAAQMVDESAILSQNAIESYKQTLELANENGIENDITRNTQERLLRFAYNMGNRMRDYGEFLNSKSVAYEAAFDSTQNYNFDDGRTASENLYFNLSDNSLAVFETAFDAKEAYALTGIWSQKLMMKLLEIDPARYAESIEKEKVEIFTDGSWLYTTTYNSPEWIEEVFDDSQWQNAELTASQTNQFEQLGLNVDAIWVKQALEEQGFAPTDTLNNSVAAIDTAAEETFSAADTALASTDSTVADTLNNTAFDVAQNDTLQQSVDPIVGVTTTSNDTLVFFRKSFNLNGKLVGGEIYLTASNDYRMYLNGEYLIDDERDDFAVLDTLDFYTFDRVAKTGNNVIAVDVLDKALTGLGFKLYGFFELVPQDLTAGEESKEVNSLQFVDKKTLKEINVLRKNRIPLDKNEELK